MNYSVSIDVPMLDEGLRFYRDALGLVEIARPVTTYVILKCGDSQIGGHGGCLLYLPGFGRAK